VGDQVRVVAQLTDALNGQLVWSERFEDRVDSVFDLQDRLAAQVAATIAPALRASEIERAQRKPPQSVTAFDLYLQALPLMRKSFSENRRALELLGKAVALDPEYAAAHALAARCHQFQLIMGWVSRSDPGQREGIRAAERAVALGQADSEALWMAGLALAILDGQVERGSGVIARALALNPNSANAWVASAMSLNFRGEYDAALERFQRAHRLNPLDTVHHFRWNLLGNTYFGAGRYAEADDAANRCMDLAPGYPPGPLLKLAVCGLTGRAAEATEALRRLLAVQPGCTLAWLSDYLGPFYGRDFVARYLEGARRAGLPEGA
jgi:adenylate cyclase